MKTQTKTSQYINFPLYHREKIPDITSNDFISWFTEPYNFDSLDTNRQNLFLNLANEVYSFIICIDDQIDFRQNQISEYSGKYFTSVVSLARDISLSNNILSKINSLHDDWMNAETLLNDEKIFDDNKLLHNCYKNKVGYLKSIPVILGDLLKDEKLTKNLCIAYDNAAIGNAYIDDLLDFKQDKSLGIKTQLSLLFNQNSNENERKIFLDKYLEKAINYNQKGLELFLHNNAVSWGSFCQSQINGLIHLQNILNFNSCEYVVNKSKNYLKGT